MTYPNELNIGASTALPNDAFSLKSDLMEVALRKTSSFLLFSSFMDCRRLVSFFIRTLR